MGTDEMLWKERLGVLIDRGVAIIVATCDDSGVPGLTRGWGPAVGRCDDVTLAVTAGHGTRTAAHLAPGAALSVTLSELTTYDTMQLLGTVEDVAPVDDAARRRVDRHLDRFVEEAARVGAQGAANVFLDDLVLVRFTVVRASDQTPGDRAGTPLGMR